MMRSPGTGAHNIFIFLSSSNKKKKNQIQIAADLDCKRGYVCMTDLNAGTREAGLGKMLGNTSDWVFGES